jgi:hypothetical protein
MEIENVVRLSVLVFGGAIVGVGFVVLNERRRFYGRLGIPAASWAMITLALVNALVMAFIATVLIDRWDAALSWRTVLAALIFASKAVFFWLLWRTAIEQERRHVFGEQRRA